MDHQEKIDVKFCLLCGEGTFCQNGDDKSTTSKLGGIVGGVGCNLLERQLEKMFILLKVLKVPSNWCGRMLQRGEEDGVGEEENGGGGNNPDKWFILCDKCVEGSVTRAWNTYQNLLKWQSRMESVRLQILEGMRRSVLKATKKNENRWDDDTGHRHSGLSQVDCEIKRYLFPGT